MTIEVLLATQLDPAEILPFRNNFEVSYTPDAARFGTFLEEGRGKHIRAAVVRNAVPFGERELDLLPSLELVVALGSGTDSIDSTALARRNVTLLTGHGVNAACVADHALAMILCLLRDITSLDRMVREKGWGVKNTPPRAVGGTRLGLIGLGAIGSEIAKRAAAFDMSIAYCCRDRQPDIQWQYFNSVAEMAETSQILVICCPGGPATRHLVNAEVLERLGTQGLVINVARGSIIDTGALITALETGRICGAALDVLDATDGEFRQLAAMRNVIITPHTAGRSPASLEAAIGHAIAGLHRHFSDHP